ncbi:T9SS type A sorting domain-containing protein [Aureivirga sp. CE67]|uniref:T9SS type A sorting domain-containing protein n=1 Tax=Aureivirga sp. CE67 TaxID=1788983 RepID=UPI0018CB4E70|nr:T9SS type A sorting domain-containing protein [Aureivirga sp. CE67]
MKKKYLLILCLFFTFLSFSQNIEFEDENLKEILVNETVASFEEDGIFITSSVDTNDDGEISLEEASAVKQLSVFVSMFDEVSFTFNELHYFDNLISLSLTNTKIPEIDLSNNTSLKRIRFNGNSFTELDLTTNDDLTSISLNESNLTHIDVTDKEQLEELILQGGDFSNIDISNNLLLKVLDFDGDFIPNLDVSIYPNLEELYCTNTNYASFDFSNNPNLSKVTFGGNSLTTLNLSNNFNLKDLALINAAELEELDLSNNSNIEKLVIFNANFSNLEVSNMTQLKELRLIDNNFIHLNLTENNEINRLTVQNLPELISLLLPDNLINSLDNFHYNGLDNLEYVCMSDEIKAIEEEWMLEMYPNLLINTFCTYSPFDAGYNIKGVVKLSENENCEEATNFQNYSLEISNELETGIYSSNNQENYNIPLVEGTYTLKPKLDYPEYFTISPESVEVTFPNTDNLEEIIQDFCISPNGEVSDVEITVIPIGLARPGFDAEYKIVYKNIGNKIVSGELDFSFEDTIIDFVSANPTEDSLNGGLISWNYENLAPFESRSVFVTLNLNSPQEDPELLGGEIIHFTSEISFGYENEMELIESFTLEQEVVNSYDPNDKTCLEGDTMRPELVGEFLTYRIRFENTGTASAVNIVVEDEINPAMFDISTIKMIDASHDCVMRTEGNLVKFFFDDIMLPHEDETNDGYVIFKIKTLDTLELEDTIENTAEIYFDFNDAIITNTAITTVKNLVIDSFGTDSLIAIYPNPATEILNISSKNSIEKVEIYSVLGKQVAEYKFDSTKQSEKLNVKTLETGVYMLKVYTTVGEKQLKLVVE